MSEKQRCQCPTKEGEQCRRNANGDSDYCWQHDVVETDGSVSEVSDVSAKKSSAEKAKAFAKKAGRKVASAGKVVGREAGKAALAAGKVGYGIAKEFGKEALGAAGDVGKEVAQEYGRKAGKAAVKAAVRKISS